MRRTSNKVLSLLFGLASIEQIEAVKLTQIDRDPLGRPLD